jgi:hypothetical protein
MVNIKSLSAILPLVGLFFVVLGLGRFGVDLWSYYHASGVGTPSQLNLRGLGAAGSGLFWFVVFLLLFLWRKH